MTAPSIHCFTTATGASLSLALPTSGSSAGPDGAKNAVVGDYLVVVACNDSTGAGPEFSASNDPAGWTFIATAGDGTSDAHVGAFYKKLDSADLAAGTFAFTSAAGAGMTGVAILLSGVESSQASALNGSSTPVIDTVPPVPITGFDTTVADCVVFAVLAFDGGDDGGFTTDATGGWAELTEHRDGTGANNTSGSISYLKMSGSGSTGTCTVDTVSVDDGTASFQFALEPAQALVFLPNHSRASLSRNTLLRM